MPFLDCCIDISHNNGAIDWAGVDPAITLVMLKATQGIGFVDPMFDRNLAGCRATGRMVIPYHFMDGTDQAAQMHFFLAHVGNRIETLALDWEGRASQTCSAEAVEAAGVALSAAIGRYPLGYWGMPGSTPRPPTEAMQRWPRWVPRYPVRGLATFDDGIAHGIARYAPRNALFWQYTQWGEIGGIDGPVDCSVFAGTEEQLRTWYDTGKMPQ